MHKTRELRLAKRMERLGTETAFEVLVKAKALEAQGRDIIHLEIADQVRIRVNKSSIADLVKETERVFEEVEESKKG